jgi:hypothetical protein
MSTDLKTGMGLQLTKHQLPALEDLYEDKELTKKINDLNTLLAAAPKTEWLKSHPTIKTKQVINGVEQDVPLTFMPIERVEYLLTRIFVRWWVEIKSSQVMANSVVTAVRLWVIDPITGEQIFQDGIGACPIQTNKGAAATDFTQVKSGAIQMAAPASETYAVKDAAEKFGKIFGKDLNRKDEIGLQEILASKFKEKPTAVPEELKLVIEGKTSLEELSQVYKTNTEFHQLKEFLDLIQIQKNKINGKS